MTRLRIKRAGGGVVTTVKSGDQDDQRIGSDGHDGLNDNSQDDLEHQVIFSKIIAHRVNCGRPRQSRERSCVSEGTEADACLRLSELAI